MMRSATSPLQALVVLGCRVGARGQAVGALARRLRVAADAYQRTATPLVVVCGGRRWSGHAEATVMREHLVGLGVPDERILLELDSINTLENARYAARMLVPRGVERVGVVTCDWHMPRALGLFTRAGLRPEPLPVASPPASPWDHLYRAARERAAGWLDARR